MGGSEVRKPLTVSKGGGDEEYGFFALVRESHRTPSWAQMTRYHSFGGYLFRGIIQPTGYLSIRGERVSVFLDCGGPDCDRGGGVGSGVSGCWCFNMRVKMTLVHPAQWDSLGITDTDINNGEEDVISRICGYELPAPTHNCSKIVRSKFDIPYVENYRGRGRRGFVPRTAIQKGVYGDAEGNFVVHFAVSMHTDFSDNESDRVEISDDDYEHIQVGGKEGELYKNAEQLRSTMMNTMMQLDCKVKNITNEVVLGIVRKEIEVLSKIVSGIPELCEFV